MEKKNYWQKITPNSQLEQARAREIFHTWETLQDKELVLFSVKASVKWFDADGVKRIMQYVKDMRDGKLE